MSVYGSIIYENNIEFINWLCEDSEFIEEGANIDMLKEFIKMKKEYKNEIKIFRSAIENKDKNAAKKSKDNLVNIIAKFRKYCNDNKHEIEEAAIFIDLLNILKSFIKSYLFSFCTKKGLELYAKKNNASIEWGKQTLLDKILGREPFTIIGSPANQKKVREANILFNKIVNIINIGKLVMSFLSFKSNDRRVYNSGNDLYIKLIKATGKLEKEIESFSLDFLDD